jgi:photosystem II stability/assembly factor-like uncharacterized protein
MRSYTLNLAARIFALFLIAMFFSTTSLAQFKDWHFIFAGDGEAVGLNPLNPNTVYAQGTDEWLYVSHDGGISWTRLSSGVAQGLREIIVHPNDTTVVLTSDFDSGLRRSTDAGVSWNTVIPNYGIDGESISYDPTAPDTIWAGNFSDGTMYKSTDRGATWTAQGTSSSEMCSVQIRPDSSSVLYAGTGSSAISKSIDGGHTWIKKKPTDTFGSETPRIVISSANPLIGFATSFDNTTKHNGVWKTTDGGESWHLTSLSDSVISGLSLWALEMDQQHPDTVYAGTFGGTTAAIYRTTDGGTSWTALSRGISSDYNVWNIQIDPLNSANVFAAVTSNSFGYLGVLKLIDADAQISGTVRDSATGQPINHGTLEIMPSGDQIDLSFTGGTYSFVRPDYDTVSTYTVNVYINDILSWQATANFVHGDSTTEDINVVRGTISGKVFNDLNSNGVQDSGEAGILNWPVVLAGQAGASQFANGIGNYAFSSLDDGSYFVYAQQQYGYTQTLPAANGTYPFSIMLGSKTSTTNIFGEHHNHRVLATWPAAYSTGNSTSGSIRILLDTSFISSTFNDSASCIVTGEQSGRHRGMLSFSGDTAIYTPAVSFFPGEIVRVNITSAVMVSGNIPVTPYLLEYFTQPAAGPGTFGPAGTYPTGSNPNTAAIADLNGDGLNDIAVTNTGSNSVSIYLNNGDGTFAPSAHYVVGAGPRSLVIADINNDGYPDIIVGNSSVGTFSVLKNNGNGTFQSHVDYSAGGGTFAIAVADMNGDGFADVITVVTGLSTFNVSLNDSAGGFHAPVATSLSGSPEGLYAADLNGDGGIDLAVPVSGTSSAVVLKQNTGGGALITSGTLSPGSNPHAAFAADLNGDNLPDLVVGNTLSNTVSIFPNVGSGFFGTPTTVATGKYPNSIACADLDGDSLLDIVTANVTGSSISVLHNQGGGTFSRTDYAAPGSPTCAAVGDLNGDGKPDIVVVNSATNMISIYLNAGILSVNVTPSWNLVSVPLPVSDLVKTSLYPTAISQAFAYSAGYVVKDTLVVGEGYWLKFGSAASVGFYGNLVSAETVNVRAGWNLIGALGIPIDTAFVYSAPYRNRLTNYFTYNNGYTSVDSLIPGSGYWVKVLAAGQMLLTGGRNLPRTLPSRSAPPEFSSVAIKDAAGREQTLMFTTGADTGGLGIKYEMPPAPPAGAFDIRFADQTMLQFADARKPAQFKISVTGAQGALSVGPSIQPADRGVWAISSGSEVHTLADKIKVTIAHPVDLTLTFSPLSSQTPRSFGLGQNYPNPFNPSTVIGYDLAQPSKVSLVIYDQLGRIVTTLVDNQESAGTYSVTWNADNLAAGVYYVTMLARNEAGTELFHSAKKLLLVK